MKKMIDYLGLFKSENTLTQGTNVIYQINVTIDWFEAISVYNIKNDSLTVEEQDILKNERVIYIFVGENKNGAKAIDVGQTSNILSERLREHLQKGDYLEGYPDKQRVYCGKVSTGIVLNRDLLEQVEGIIIHRLTKKRDYHLCNDSKRNTFTCSYKISYLLNKNRHGDLCVLLSSYMFV